LLPVKFMICDKELDKPGPFYIVLDNALAPTLYGSQEIIPALT